MQEGESLKKAKHKWFIPDDYYDYVNKEYLLSIRNKALVKLAYLLFQLSFDSTYLRKLTDKRITEENKKRQETNEICTPIRPTFDNLIYFMELNDICELLKCSERTAKEFLDTLEAIHKTMQRLGHMW